VAILVDDNSTMTIPFIAHTLFEGNVVPGMSMITDRYYGCTSLVEYCIAMQVGYIASTTTLRFLAKHKLTGWSKAEAKLKDRGTFQVATNNDRSVACVIWKDKGVVRLTMTTSSTARCKVVRAERGKRSFTVTAPTAAMMFDRYFHGVDRNDQLRGKGYGLALTFRAQKYTVKLFLGLLDIVLSNTWILWRFFHPKDHKKHRSWMNKLAAEMLVFNPDGDPEYAGAPRAEGEAKHNSVPLAMGKRKRSGKECAIRKQATCPMCSTASGKRKRRTSFGCPECNVALCPGACHQQWHQLSETERKEKKPRKRTLEFASSGSKTLS
jgi:hypothetical protein